MSQLFDPIQLLIGELLTLMARLTANPPLLSRLRFVYFRFGTNDVIRRRPGRIRRVLLTLRQRHFQLRYTLIENRQTTITFRTPRTVLFLRRLRHHGFEITDSLENHQDQFRIREWQRTLLRSDLSRPVTMLMPASER